MSPRIHHLFPTTIMEFNLGREINEKENEYIDELEKSIHENIGNRTSLEHYVLNNEKMKEINSFILESVNVYLTEIISPKSKLEPYVTQSWINFTYTKEFHHRHSHPNSLISGVFYIKASEDDDKIVFYNSKEEYLFKIYTDNHTIHNSDSWWLPANTGKLYLFSSKLIHEVPPVKNTEKRVSLAFNVFVKGQIGEDMALYDLILS